MRIGQVKSILVAVVAVLAMPPGLTAAGAEELSARAAVEAAEVFVGQAFQFQVQVSGSENPQEPDLSGL